MVPMSNLILYTTEDGRSRIQLRAQEQTVWLRQLELAELFAPSKQNIEQHLKSIFAEGELTEASVVKQHFTTAVTVKESLTVQIEGSREVQRPVTLYNLDAILAVGYRVRSPRGVQFRRWASTVLKEYLTKGFVMEDERLKNPDGRPDYFDEMLARIRDHPAPTRQPSRGQRMGEKCTNQRGQRWSTFPSERAETNLKAKDEATTPLIPVPVRMRLALSC